MIISISCRTVRPERFPVTENRNKYRSWVPVKSITAGRNILFPVPYGSVGDRKRHRARLLNQHLIRGLLFLCLSAQECRKLPELSCRSLYKVKDGDRRRLPEEEGVAFYRTIFRVIRLSGLLRVWSNIKQYKKPAGRVQSLPAASISFQRSQAV